MGARLGMVLYDGTRHNTIILSGIAQRSEGGTCCASLLSQVRELNPPDEPRLDPLAFPDRYRPARLS